MKSGIKIYVGKACCEFLPKQGISLDEGIRIIESWLLKKKHHQHYIRVQAGYKNLSEIFIEYGFKYSKAAGGVIIDKKNNIWLIRRWGFWDLPKGKCENGELDENCAVREVREECSILDATIERFLDYTYHAFILNGEKILKRTAWFLMHSDQSWAKAQTEEFIEEVVKVPILKLTHYFPEMHLALQNLLQESILQLTGNQGP